MKSLRFFSILRAKFFNLFHESSNKLSHFVNLSSGAAGAEAQPKAHERPECTEEATLCLLPVFAGGETQS